MDELDKDPFVNDDEATEDDDLHDVAMDDDADDDMWDETEE